LAKWADQDVPSKADAQAVLDTFRAAIRDYMRAGIQRDALLTRLRAGQKAQQATAQPLTFSAFADVYLDRYVKANGLKSVATIECRMATIKAHFGDRALTDIRTADLEDFLAHLRQPMVLAPGQKTERTRRPATVNRYRSQLVQMFNWAISRDYVERSPFAKGGQTLIHATYEDNKRDRPLSADEEQRLLATAAPHLKLMITAALYSGMRRGEMLALTWADVTDRAGWIRLRGDTTKSGKTRWVPIHPNVQAVLDFLRTDANGDDKPADGPVFSNEVGEAAQFPKTAWQAALGRAKIRNFRWHDLRHEFAGRLTERGVPLVHVRDLLGHVSVTTTERYETQQADRLKAAMQMLPGDERPAADPQDGGGAAATPPSEVS